MGPPLPAPDPPAVLKPGKLGLAGVRPDKIDGNPTSPCSYGGMHGFTHGLTVTVRNLFYCKIVAILFPRKRPRAACRQFSGSNQLSCVPKASILCLFSWKKTKFFSRFHVAGAVGSFICDVTFRHQSHERSNLIFCCNIFTSSS